MAPLPRVPGYDILRPLGGGPLTQVFAACRADGDMLCAIKLPRDGWADHADAVRLLRREAGVLRAVRHPHVVRLIESHVAEPPHFLVLELLSGESLRDRLQREFVVDRRDALWIARQVADGLQALHYAGFVHGDVKPENVQLVEGGSAVLVDLGFAHAPGDNGSLETDGYVLGTANYLAPEQVATPTDDGFAADWFSFGVMFFELLTGELPHPPRSLVNVLNHSVDEYETQPALLRNWPERLSALVSGMLERLPSNRPRGPLVVHELIALEIAALGRRRAG